MFFFNVCDVIFFQVSIYYYPPHMNASSDGDPGPGVGDKDVWEEITVSIDQLLLTATDKSRHLTFFDVLHWTCEANAMRKLGS